MPTRAFDAVLYVQHPLEFSVEDGHVVIAVRSGRWAADLTMSETTFFASCAKAGIIASELRAKSKRGQLVSIRRDKPQAG